MGSSATFDAINQYTPYRCKRSAPDAAPRLGRKTLLSPADMTRLNEHITRVSDVLCLSAVTISSLVRDSLEAQVLDVRPGKWWVRQLFHGMHLSCKKPAKCVKELHGLEQQHATRTDSYQAVLADEHLWRQRRPRPEHRRDFVPLLAGASDRSAPPRRPASSAAGQNEGAATFTVTFIMERGPLDMLMQIMHARKTDAVWPEQPWPERTRHVTSENGWATTATILQLAATLDDVLNPGKQGPAWILLWDMASCLRDSGRSTHGGAVPSSRAVLHPLPQHVLLAAWPSSAASRAASRRRSESSNSNISRSSLPPTTSCLHEVHGKNEYLQAIQLLAPRFRFFLVPLLLKAKTQRIGYLHSQGPST